MLMYIFVRDGTASKTVPRPRTPTPQHFPPSPHRDMSHLHIACYASQVFEALDLFVGRYLLLTTVGYVGIKFVHFKIFDPFP